MKDDTIQILEQAKAALYAVSLLVERDTQELALDGDTSELARHYSQVRDGYDALKERLARVDAEVNKLSYDIIPTTFTNRGIKSVKVEGVGNIGIGTRWNASMIRRDEGMDWLRANDAAGLIVETVNAQTLAGFARERAIEGKPLPTDIFKVGTSLYTTRRAS